MLPNINEKTTFFGRQKKKGQSKKRFRKEQERESVWIRKERRNSDYGT